MLVLRIAAISLALTLAACGGGGGSSGSTIAPVVALAVAPATVVAGNAATLNWNATDATDCVASGGWSGSRGPSGTESTGVLNASRSYTLTCTGDGGTAAQTASVTVTPPAAPVVTLTASPQTVTSGQAATLTWSAPNADSCTASGSWNGTRATSGSQTTGSLSGNVSYTLTCTNAGGSAGQTASVTVIPAVGAPTVNLAVTPSSVLSGNAASLSWSTANATGCTASGGWSGSRATSGSEPTPVLTLTTGYTLTCTGPGGSASQTVTVTVTTPPVPTVTLSANPTSLAAGASSTLTWSSTNATTCSASGGWSGTRATNGSASTNPLASTTTYTLTCTGTGGSASQSATVTVLPAPSVTLSANPTSLASGASSTLTWSSTNATTCTASGGWSGTKPTAGTTSTGTVSATTTYTLTCTGGGGSTGRSVTVVVTGGSSPFPLRVEAGKRYLITAQGTPFLIHGDTPWCLITQLTREQVDQYLEDRRLKGFNTVLVELIEPYFSTNAPRNVYGDAPFATGADFATRNDVYFDHAEYVVGKAREKGMLVLMAPAYLGYNGGAQGWYQEMGAAGNTVLQDYGRYIASRFQAYDNILWVNGGDYNPPDRTRMRAVINGILEVDTTSLHSFHGARGTAALQWLTTSETWLDVNTIYTDKSTVIAEAQGEYNRATMPFFLVEGDYENESTSSTQTRQQAWQAVLSGATGQLMGEAVIWPFATNWQSSLNTEGASTLVHLRTLLESYAWWTLVPDFSNTFLTGGVLTGASRAPAAVAADGSFAIVYVNTVRALTVNLAALSGSQVQARWYDPTSGSFTTVSGSPFAASGSGTFTPTGNNFRGKTDWVLVLDALP